MKKSMGLALALAAMLAFTGVSFAKNHHKHHNDGPPPPFSSADFSGTYVANFTGAITANQVTGQLTGNGLVVATPTDSTDGTISGSETLNDGALGDVCTGTITGNYTVNPDGTGTLAINFTPAGPIDVGTCVASTSNTNIVIQSDNHVSVVETDQYRSVLGQLSKQNPVETNESDNGHHNGSDG